MKVAILGGGLAGCALAYTLKKAGLIPVIYEAGAHLAAQASGNVRGLYNPRFSAQRSTDSLFYMAAFEHALAVFDDLKEVDIEWNPCGALHLIADEKKAVRFPKTVQNWDWGSEHLQMVSAQEASHIAGVDLKQGALHHPRAGTISPQKLCTAAAQGVDVVLNARVQDLSDLKEEVVVLACGSGALSFAETKNLPLHTIRGQVSVVKSTLFSENLKCNLCYGGYFSPAMNGVHVLGATFQRWLSHTDIVSEDDEYNIQKLALIAPELAAGLEVVHHRAALRVSSKDHFPVAGRLQGHENLYVSTAHGSHGILSAFLSAQLIVELILGKVPSLPQEVVRALTPERFL